MNKIIFPITLVFIFLVLPTKAQEILLSEDLAQKEEIPTWGPNRKFNAQLVMKIAFMLPEEKAQLKGWYLGNQNYSALYQFILKQSNRISWVGELGYNLDQYRFNPEQESPIDGNKYIKEHLIIHYLEGNYKLRVNFERKRGAHLGNYMELGYFTDFRLGATRQLTTKGLQNSDRYKKQVSKQTGLSYLNNFSHGPLLQLGFNGIGVYFKYNFASLLAQPFEAVMLPSSIVGLHFRLSN